MAHHDDWWTSFFRGPWTQVQAESAHSSIRIYAYAELCELLRAAGFGSFQGLETMTGARFELGSRRLCLIATKD